MKLLCWLGLHKFKAALVDNHVATLPSFNEWHKSILYSHSQCVRCNKQIPIKLELNYKFKSGEILWDNKRISQMRS